MLVKSRLVIPSHFEINKKADPKMSDAGFELRSIMHKSGWTQSQIADELGVSTAAVNQWAKRGIPAARAIDIANLTQAPLEVCERAVYQPPPRRATPRYNHGYQSYADVGEDILVCKAALDEYQIASVDVKFVTELIKRLGKKRL